MTVSEIIAELCKYDRNLEVLDNDGFTISVNIRTIEDKYEAKLLNMKVGEEFVELHSNR